MVSNLYYLNTATGWNRLRCTIAPARCSTVSQYAYTLVTSQSTWYASICGTYLICVTILRFVIHKYNYHSPVVTPHRESKPPWKLDILLFNLAQFCSPNMSDSARKILGNRMTSWRMRLDAHEGHSSKGKERKSRDLTTQQCAAAETINTNKTLYVMRTSANHRLGQRFPNQSIRPLDTLMPSYGTVCKTS